MLFFNKNKVGFTLIEITVSLFIIVLLVSLTIANYNTGYSGANLVGAQESLFQNIKLAQSYALSYRSYDDILPKNWGVYLEASSSYAYLFADLNENNVYDNGEADAFLGGREIYLSIDTELSYLSFGASAISVLFESGTGIMNIYDVDLASIDNNPWLVELKDKKIDLARLIILEPPIGVYMKNCFCSESDDYCCSFCSPSDSCIDFESE